MDPPLSELTIDKCLKVNIKKIVFENKHPGGVTEDSLIITNQLSNTKIAFTVRAICEVEEYEELDEYVYSLRRPSASTSLNYIDVFNIILTPGTTSYFKVAVKVPSIAKEGEIKGKIVITGKDVPG